MVTGCAIKVVSDFCCALCRLVIIQGEYLIRIVHSPAKKPVMLGVMEAAEKREEKANEARDNCRVYCCGCRCSARDSDLGICKSYGDRTGNVCCRSSGRSRVSLCCGKAGPKSGPRAGPKFCQV